MFTVLVHLLERKAMVVTHKIEAKFVEPFMTLNLRKYTTKSQAIQLLVIMQSLVTCMTFT